MKYFLTFLAVVVFCSFTSVSQARLNVLFIVSDDLNVDLASYGHPQVKTPNIDRLRERSMVFEYAYTQFPICNPSRNSFLTGQYPGRTGCLDNLTNIREVAPDIITMPEYFKKNEYRAISTGKVFHSMDTRSWTHISDVKTGGLLALDEEPRFYEKGYEENKTRGEGRLIVDETVGWFQWRSVVEGEEYLKDYVVANATIKRIDEVLEDNASFFMGVGFSRPHDPYYAPKRFFDMYPLESLHLPVAPDDAWVVPSYAFNETFKRAFDKMSEQDKREALRAYYAGVSYMDEQLGRVLDHVESKGLLNNTVIVFIGDHGYHLGEKGYWNKSLLFDRACRTPLLISVPGMETAGKKCSRIVELVDIYPTLIELCGLTVPDDKLDGKSLVSLLKNPESEVKELAFSYNNADRSVRDARFRYIVWREGAHALYDHENDPNEHYNLADNPQYSAIVERMKTLIAEMPEPNKKNK